MQEWYSSIYKAFIIGTLICFIISIFTSGATAYNSYVTGYSILILALMMILTMIITKVLKVMPNGSSAQLMITILLELGPFLLVLAIIAFILYLIIYYKKAILEGRVSSNYNTFSNITIILLLVQLYIVYGNIFTNEFENSGKLSKKTTGLLYLVGVLSLISTSIIYILLKYYRTDGFTMIGGV